MGRKKRGKKKKIKIVIRKKVPKIKLKKKKSLTISETKQTKGNGLFKSFFKSFENFKKKQKIESFKQIKFGGKEREKQIKEEHERQDRIYKRREKYQK